MQLDLNYVSLRLKDHHVTLTDRQCMNHAAGIGDANPACFDDERPGGIVAHPLLATALTWQVAGRVWEFLPQSDFPAHLLLTQVHYSEHLVFHQPMRPGMRLVLAGQVTAILPHRSGTLVVLRFDADQEDGGAVFTEYAGGILRGVTCDPPGAGQENLPALPPRPESAPLQWAETLAVDPLASYVYDGCADIHFPIHTSPRFAHQLGLPGVIVQGTLLLAWAARAIIQRQAGGNPLRLAELACRFAGMVLPGETLLIRLFGAAETQDFTSPHYFFDVLKADGKPAIREGYARIAASPDPQS